MTKTSPSFLPAKARTKTTADWPDEGLIKLSVVAKLLGVSAVTIRRRVADGSLRPIRSQGRLYFEPREVRAFITRHRDD